MSLLYFAIITWRDIWHISNNCILTVADALANLGHEFEDTRTWFNMISPRASKPNSVVDALAKTYYSLKIKIKI